MGGGQGSGGGQVYYKYAQYPIYSSQPFLEPDHFLHRYFLSRWYAVGGPVAAGVTLASLVGVFVGVVLMKEQARKKQK